MVLRVRTAYPQASRGRRKKLKAELPKKKVLLKAIEDDKLEYGLRAKTNGRIECSDGILRIV